ncbi:MAG: glucose-6-phosphate isomerase, partial [SAR202 cluster bacterium]|nr:glucose-6-phosphate isomerase [SAR202 cluster bacterium]
MTGLTTVEAALAELERGDVVARIWRRDHTVWSPEPTGISDRLGWLSVTETIRGQVSGLQTLSQQVRAEGVRHVVLLGMGGSSLASEVMRRTFGSKAGYPELHVLDSTLPSAVSLIARSVDIAKALFVVSSKSGTTAEPNLLYRYFRMQAEREVGVAKAGRCFIAITDPGSPLAALGRSQGFREVFENDPTIGGRYSALSYFGMVPAALIGVDIGLLLQRADLMREWCSTDVAVRENPGALLGTVIGTLASKGRDKLTMMTSPSIASFGLWMEQLLAESTGKDRRGVVPVADELPCSPEAYGADRVFVHVRLERDDNDQQDGMVKELEKAGHPVFRIDLTDAYDLGAEFFRWEFATAVAASILHVQPFSQPHVQSAKDATNRLLAEFEKTGTMPSANGSDSFESLLSKASEGKYLAIMAYVRQTPEVDRAFAEFRRAVMESYRIATTLGYGPRYLHSTGQLHKGGPDTGLFLHIVEQQD